MVGFGQALESGFLGDVDYSPENQKLQTEKSDADKAVSEASRGEQQDLGQYYKDTLAGKKPSVAQQQMMQGRDQAMKAAMAGAASGRGAGVAQAGRAGTTAASNISMQTGRDAAMLRAGEQSTAAGQYQNLLNTQRMQDLTSRGMSIDEAKAQLDYEAKLQQTRSNIAIAEQQGAQKGVAGMMSAAGGAMAMFSSEELKDDIAVVGGEQFEPEPARITDIQEDSTPDTRWGELPPDIAAELPPERSVPFNMDTLPNTAPQEGESEKGTGSPLTRALAAGFSGYGAGLSGNYDSHSRLMDKLAADQKAAAKAKNPNITKIGMGGQPLYNPNSMDKSMPRSEMTAREQFLNDVTESDERSKNEYSDDTFSQGQSTTAEMLEDKGGLLANLTGSDERAKNVESLSRALSRTKEERYPTTEEFAKVPTKEFSYKRELQPVLGEDDSRYTGPMAQDLEKVRPLAGTVKEDPSGFKKVHTGHVALANTSAIGELTRRLKELEAQKDAEIADLRRLTMGRGDRTKKALSGRLTHTLNAAREQDGLPPISEKELRTEVPSDERAKDIAKENEQKVSAPKTGGGGGGNKAGGGGGAEFLKKLGYGDPTATAFEGSEATGRVFRPEPKSESGKPMMMKSMRGLRDRSEVPKFEDYSLGRAAKSPEERELDERVIALQQDPEFMKKHGWILSPNIPEAQKFEYDKGALSKALVDPRRNEMKHIPRVYTDPELARGDAAGERPTFIPYIEKLPSNRPRPKMDYDPEWEKMVKENPRLRPPRLTPEERYSQLDNPSAWAPLPEGRWGVAEGPGEELYDVPPERVRVVNKVIANQREQAMGDAAFEVKQAKTKGEKKAALNNLLSVLKRGAEGTTDKMDAKWLKSEAKARGINISDAEAWNAIRPEMDL